MSHVKREIFKT